MGTRINLPIVCRLRPIVFGAITSEIMDNMTKVTIVH